MISADKALIRLKEGNRRFVSEGSEAITGKSRRKELAEGQNPFAIILGCSDSRVPAEIVFDQGLGDLFVIRVAGNIVAPSQIGSIEFAADKFGTRLVVVLGHSMCGAVISTLEELQQPTENRSPNLSSIVNRVIPSIEPLLKNASVLNEKDLIEQAVKANINRSVDQLQHGSDILEDLIKNDGLKIFGAEYSLETGIVEFLR